MASPLASLSTTRGFRVNVEPSFRVAVYGRPDAAGDSAAVVAAALGADVGAGGAPLPPHATASSEAAAPRASARSAPDRMVCSSSPRSAGRSRPDREG